jgi:alpha-1,2-rhamnosyltransferase
VIAWFGYYGVRMLYGPFIDFRRGDTVLLIDSTWGFPRMLEALLEAQKNKVKVAPMMHDLFPLLLPDTCEDITVRYYRQWFNAIVPRADFFITNSRSTGRTLEQYLEQHPEIRALPILHDSFRLGADLDLLETRLSHSDHYTQLWGVPGHVILAIGTIEPRKNHKFLLDAFEVLRSRGCNVSLVLIGKVGWKSGDVVARIEGHPDLNTRLLHFSNADDRLLADAIERADCIVCPSIAEGFGLPVVEGLMRGKEIFASDIEVFREIGEQRCQFFSLSDPGDLASKLERWFEEGEQVAQSRSAKKFHWPNWQESSAELVDKALMLARRHRSLIQQRASRSEGLCESEDSGKSMSDHMGTGESL